MEVNYMSSKSFEAASLLTALSIAQRENDLEVCSNLIQRLNDLQVLQTSDLNMEAIFNPHWSVVNDAYFLVVDELDGFADREITRFKAKSFKAANSGKPEVYAAFVRELLDQPEIFEKLTLSTISGMIGFLVQYGLDEELLMVQQAMYDLSVKKQQSSPSIEQEEDI